jgi:hypothetical protein
MRKFSPTNHLPPEQIVLSRSRHTVVLSVHAPVSAGFRKRTNHSCIYSSFYLSVIPHFLMNVFTQIESAGRTQLLNPKSFR